MAVDLAQWAPSDWRGRTALQQPDYADGEQALRAIAAIAQGGPLVTAEECARLREACAEAVRSEAFILQAGDCAESLDAEPAAAAAAMGGMIARLGRGATQPVVAIGRIGGQFAKPRTALEETRGGRALPVYRGDAVNGAAFSEGARANDPGRMVGAYRHSAATIAHLRVTGGLLFASHEALLLPYEEALCFRDEAGRWWAGSGHMLWIGERTRDPEGAHVAFAAGVNNALGVKCGPAIMPEELVRLSDRLDPWREAGRLVLIARMGAERIGEVLPPLLREARREGLAAGWMLDPMHGNTRRVGGRKQRRVADMVAEAEKFAAICASEGVVPVGIHLEVTAGEAECVGEDGVDPLADFPCDPRLSEAQARLVVEAMTRC